MEASPSDTAAKWLDLWRNVIFHPNAKVLTILVNDPKVSIKPGTAWMAIGALIAWYLGPQRGILWGWVIDNFGLQAEIYFYTLGALLAVFLAVIFLLVTAAVSQGLSMMFNGQGSYKQLVYAWGVIPLPFILLAGLVMLIPLLFSNSREFLFSPVGLILQLITILFVVVIILYSTYVEIVAFSAVEKFSLGKGFCIFILSAIVVCIVGILVSMGMQSVL